MQRLPRLHLLAQHRFGVGLVLLQTRQGLRRGVQLRVQAGQHVEVGLFLPGQLPDVFLLEGRQLPVLLVQVALGILELCLEEISCSLGALLRAT